MPPLAHRTCVLSLISGALFSTANAAEYVAANLFDNPDSLYAWDSTGALIYQPAGVTLASDFILGLYLTDLRNGNYISAYTTSGQTTTGFCSLTNGVSTKLHALPFLSPAYSGLVKNAAGTGFITLADSDWLSTAVPYKMYSIDASGNFSYMMDISTPGLNDPEIKGLTRNPLTGVLFAYEQTNNVLVTINETTGLVSTVGSLGVDAAGAGGLAFAVDGSELILATSNDFEYRINPQTGHATLIGVFVNDPSRPESLTSIVPEPTLLGGMLVGLALRQRKR